MSGSLLSYLIIISAQIILTWEIIKWAIKNNGDKYLIVYFIILVLFNYILYEGGFYRLPWVW